jgi:hypothetical protein
LLPYFGSLEQNAFREGKGVLSLKRIGEEARRVEETMDQSSLSRYFDDGYSLLWSSIERFGPSFDLAAEVESKLGLRTWLNAYRSPRGGEDEHRRALPPHFDYEDVVVLQLEGSKNWTLCPRQPLHLLVLPLEPEYDDDNEQAAADYEETRIYRACYHRLLQPGDMMYMPRGTVHYAGTAEAGSLHLAMGVSAAGFSWGAVLLLVLRYVLRQNLLGGEDARLACVELQRVLQRVLQGVPTDTTASVAASVAVLRRTVPVHLLLRKQLLVPSAGACTAGGIALSIAVSPLDWVSSEHDICTARPSALGGALPITAVHVMEEALAEALDALHLIIVEDHNQQGGALRMIEVLRSKRKWRLSKWRMSEVMLQAVLTTARLLQIGALSNTMVGGAAPTPAALTEEVHRHTLVRLAAAKRFNSTTPDSKAEPTVEPTAEALVEVALIATPTPTATTGGGVDGEELALARHIVDLESWMHRGKEYTGRVEGGTPEERAHGRTPDLLLLFHREGPVAKGTGTAEPVAVGFDAAEIEGLQHLLFSSNQHADGGGCSNSSTAGGMLVGTIPSPDPVALARRLVGLGLLRVCHGAC